MSGRSTGSRMSSMATLRGEPPTGRSRTRDWSGETGHRTIELLARPLRRGADCQQRLDEEGDTVMDSCNGFVALIVIICLIIGGVKLYVMIYHPDVYMTWQRAKQEK